MSPRSAGRRVYAVTRPLRRRGRPGSPQEVSISSASRWSASAATASDRQQRSSTPWRSTRGQGRSSTAANQSATSARFFDLDGRPIPGPVEERVPAVSLEQLARIPLVAGVAAGAEKARGVLGALRSGAVDVLISDSSLARALLSAQGSSDMLGTTDRS
ncbi:sugar-binding domain-containing protein [Streptomyces brasiliscabiei]|uniref:Sugar-binding domain-containing protein n=1 Tax=Streptomyces brasiliscabiei TaxID=2736302 RepID=A0ABU8G432_9ACTN